MGASPYVGAAKCGLMVPWVVGACVTPADGSPNIVGGAEFVLQNSARAGVSTGMHYCGGPQITLQGVLAIGGSLAGSLMTPSL